MVKSLSTNSVLTLIVLKITGLVDGLSTNFLLTLFLSTGRQTVDQLFSNIISTENTRTGRQGLSTKKERALFSFFSLKDTVIVKCQLTAEINPPYILFTLGWDRSNPVASKLFFEDYTRVVGQKRQ